MNRREETEFKSARLKIKQERLFSDILSICNEGALPKAGYEQKVKDWFNDTLVKENGDAVPVRREMIDGREYIFDVPPWTKEIDTIEEAGQIAGLRYHMALALRHKWENDFRTREAKAAMKRGEEAGDHAKLILKNYEAAKELIDRDLLLWDMAKRYRENEKTLEDYQKEEEPPREADQVFLFYPEFKRDYQLLEGGKFLERNGDRLKWLKSKKSLSEYFGYQKKAKGRNAEWKSIEALFEVTGLKNSFSNNGDAYGKNPSKDYKNLLEIKNALKGK
ncbi:MAG: hypothetical protein LBK08_05825 [Treponema sp.]|jgi:hypothetical protein|nr:hypothetical protein [Treponema sp.]